MKARLITAALAAASLAGLALASAGPAAAAVPHVALPDNCLTGSYAGYCGHQTAPDGMTLTVGANRAITAQPFLTPNTQMVWENPPGQPVPADNAKVALWFGQLPGFKFAMTQVGSHAYMEQYVPGDAAQLWVFDGTGWQNEGSGDVITDHGFVSNQPVSVDQATGGTPYTFIEG